MKKMTRIIHAPVAAITLGWLAVQFTPNGFGVVPPPDGGYPGFTTAEGTKALQSLTTGSGNTGIGWVSLFSVTDGSYNTGVGAGTLALNTSDENTATGTAALLLIPQASVTPRMERLHFFTTIRAAVTQLSGSTRSQATLPAGLTQRQVMLHY